MPLTYAAGQVPGTSTSDAAAAGNVGEYISSTVVLGSAVALTTGVTANITSISLTAGDWDVSGVPYFLPANTTSVTRFIAEISQASASIGGSPGAFFSSFQAATVYNGSVPVSFSIPPYRQSLAATTTIYLVAQTTHTVAGVGAYGIISARRVR